MNRPAALPWCERCQEPYEPLPRVCDGCPYCEDPIIVAAAKEPKRYPRSVEAKLATGQYDVCPDCKTDLKRRIAERCKACSLERRRKPGARYGRTCRCGGKKNEGAEMGRSCRYGRAA